MSLAAPSQVAVLQARPAAPKRPRGARVVCKANKTQERKGLGVELGEHTPSCVARRIQRRATTALHTLRPRLPC